MNVFLLNSNSTQLFDAEELKYKLGIKADQAVLGIRNLASATTAMQVAKKEELLKYGQWKEIYLVPVTNGTSFFLYLKNFFIYNREVKKIIKKYSPISSLFIGNYKNEPMRHIANKLAAKGTEIYFLDEGTSTLRFYKSREENLTNIPGTNQQKEKGLKKISRFFKSAILGFKIDEVKQPVTFFTQYPIHATQHTKVIPNDFSLLKSNMSHWKKTNDIYFIGSPFIYFKNITPENYLKLFAAVCDHFKGQKIIYIPHPREAKADYEQLALHYPVEIKLVDSVVEYYLIMKQVLPGFVAGFTSSAISQISKMFGNNISIVSFKIPPAFLLQKHEVFKNIYNYFSAELASDHFKLVDIDPAGNLIGSTGS